jgi:lysophospholipase L1-like esterase
VAVVNAGIGGNRITGPETYSPQTPFAGGPSALERLERDVLGLSGLSTVIWLEGINDLSAGATAEAVIEGLRQGVARLRARGVRVIGATITAALGAAGLAGTAEVDVRRQTVNTFIRTSGIFDAVADFDRATLDPSTGALRAEFQPGSTTGGPGDRLHPNRAGYQAMASSIDLDWIAPAGAVVPAENGRDDGIRKADPPQLSAVDEDAEDQVERAEPPPLRSAYGREDSSAAK